MLIGKMQDQQISLIGLANSPGQRKLLDPLLFDPESAAKLKLVKIKRNKIVKISSFH